MATTASVKVCCLDGSELTKEMQTSDILGMLRVHISAELALDPRGFRLLAESSVLPDDTPIQSIAACDGGQICIQLIKFDPLLDLGVWEKSNHEGISRYGRCHTLVKTSAVPDSNNVFLRHQIHEPCFVEFDVVKSRDEMSFGVTYEAEWVEKMSGYGNLSTNATWLYSKKKSMPTLIFAGSKISPADVPSFGEGDRIAVYADPEQREVRFYKNGTFVASNLPEHPLPLAEGKALRMYGMVDQVNDQVSLNRFGPGLPYDTSTATSKP